MSHTIVIKDDVALIMLFDHITSTLSLTNINSGGPLIVMTWENLKTISEQRAGDYLAGVVAGIVHSNLVKIKVKDE